MITGEIVYKNSAGKTIKAVVHGFNEKNLREKIAKRVEKLEKAGNSILTKKMIKQEFDRFADIPTNLITKRVNL